MTMTGRATQRFLRFGNLAVLVGVAVLVGCASAWPGSGRVNENPQRERPGGSTGTNGGGQPSPATIGDESPFKIQRHGLLVRCGGAPTEANNPYSVQRDLLADPYKFFAEQIRRARAMRDASGHNRIVFHMLNGWGRLGMEYSTAVLDAMPGGRRAAFVDAVKTLRSDGFDVGVYLSCKVPQTTDSITVEQAGPLEQYDPSNERHREVFVEGILEPLIEVGVNELWFDNASTNREPFAKLAEEMRPRGVHVVIEAIPVNSDRSIDMSIVKRVPASALDRFIYLNNQMRDGGWFPLPNDVELIAIITSHQTVDDAVPTTADERNQYLIERMRERFEQGFAVFNMQPWLDDAFFGMLAEPANRRHAAN